MIFFNEFAEMISEKCYDPKLEPDRSAFTNNLNSGTEDSLQYEPDSRIVEETKREEILLVKIQELSDSEDGEIRSLSLESDFEDLSRDLNTMTNRGISNSEVNKQ